MKIGQKVSHKTEFFWCLEEVRFRRDGKIRVRGWVCAKKKGRDRAAVPVISVLNASGRTVPVSVRRSVRTDVNKIYFSDHPDYQSGFIAEWLYKAAGNFAIRFRAGFAEAECPVRTKDRICELFEAKRVICPADRDGISWCVDRVDFPDQERIRVRGWAFARSGPSTVLPDITVRDRSGSDVSASVRRVPREDVERVFFGEAAGETANPAVGFTLIWEFLPDRVYEVRFRSGEYGDRYPVDIRSEQAEKREESRHYIDHEAMRQFGDPCLEQDTKWMKQNWSRAKYDAAMRHRFSPRDPAYTKYVHAACVTDAELDAQRNTSFAVTPKISVIVPTYRTPVRFLREMIDSVRVQTYVDWELCIWDGSEGDAELERVLSDYSREDPRVRYRTGGKNLGISGNTNEALKMAEGEFIALLDHDDVFAPNALFEMVSALNRNPSADFFYSDEDKYEADIRDRYEPAFKPEFGWDFFCTNNFICHLTMIRTELIRSVGGFRKEYDGAQDYDLFLRCAEQASGIVHIPKVLYHWRCHPGSTASNPSSKPYAVTAGRNAVIEHFRRIGREEVKVTDLADRLYYYREYFPADEETAVDLFLDDGRESEARQKENEEQIRGMSGWKHLRIFHQAAPDDPSDRADYVIFLDGTAKILTGDWVGLLLGECAGNGAGAAGGKTLIRERTIDQAGMAYGADGDVLKLLHGEPAETYGPNCRGLLQQEKSILSLSCVMVKKSVLLKAGLPDGSLTGKYRDADFSFRVREAGYRLVYEPNVVVSVSGTPDLPLNTEEQEDCLCARWSGVLAKTDPFYGPNFSAVKTDFSYREFPEDEKADEA